MGGWILASNIRQALLGCVTSVLKDEERSGRVRSSSEFLAADHHPQFKWHVEARKVVHAIEFNCRQVMNAVRRFTNKSYDFIQADITTVSCFQRRAWPESTGNYGKQHALKKLFEIVRKGTIDKNEIRVDDHFRPCHWRPYFFFEATLRTADERSALVSELP